MEAREHENQAPAPGTEPDRYAPDERKQALQAIKEELEEEERQRAEEADFKAVEMSTEPDVELPRDSQEVADSAEEAAPEVSPEAAEEQEETSKTQAMDEARPVAQEQQPVPDNLDVEEKVQMPSEQDAAERKQIVDEFLAKNGFDGVSNKRRRTLRPSIYPLHLAAEKGDAKLIRLLLEAGADRLLTDSLNRTPEAVARKTNRKGSHDEALAVLASL